MPKKTKPPESLWSCYLECVCEIHQYCFGLSDPDKILSKIDTETPIEEHERAKILRMLGFDPDSATVWIGVNKEEITIGGKCYYKNRQFFAGDGKEPHSRFAVIY